MEIQKIFSDMYDDERLYSVLLTEDEMDLYQSIFSDQRMYTWQDSDGNIWDGAKGDRSKLKYSASDLKKMETVEYKGGYRGSTGTGEVYREPKVINKKEQLKKAKQANKAAKEEWKKQHSKENVAKVEKQVAKKKAELAVNEANRARLVAKGAKAGLKKGLLIGGGATLAAGAGIGTAAYLKNRNKGN